MADWLILQLSRNPDDGCAWMLADPAGLPQQSPQTGSLLQAASAAHGRRIAVIVPSADVLTTEVELPPARGGVRAPQVVAYALEEQLAADIETLHFAAGVRVEPNPRTPVAVVARGLMQQWMEALTAAGLAPEVMAPEAALLPENPGHTSVLLADDTLCVRAELRNAVALPADDIGAALDATLGEELLGTHVSFYVTPQDWQQRSAEVEALRPRCATLKVHLLNVGPLPLLAPQLLAARGVLNLLSGEYQPKRTGGGEFKRWRLAAGLAAAVFVVHIAGLSLQLWQQHRSEQSLDADISDVAHSALPGDSGTGNVRARAEQALLTSQAAGGATGFMAALAALAQSVEGVNGTSIQSLSYRQGGLDLQLRANDAESMERINQSLRQRGWQAEITSDTRAAGGSYEGHIQVRAPGSTAKGS